MPAMTKRVNVRTTVPVRTIIPPLSGSKKNTIMSCSDILKCLCRRAIVDEILPDGRTVRLTMDNYCKDNGAGLDAYHPKKVIAQAKEPVADPRPSVQEESKVNANIVMKSDLENDVKDDNDKEPEKNSVEKESAVKSNTEDTDINKTEEIPNDTNNNEVYHKNNKKNKH